MNQRALNQFYLYRYIVVMVLSVIAVVAVLWLALFTITWRYAQNIEPLFSESSAAIVDRKMANQRVGMLQQLNDQEVDMAIGDGSNQRDLGVEVLNSNSVHDDAQSDVSKRNLHLEQLIYQSRREFEFALMFTIILPVMIVVLGVYFYRRVLYPLRNLDRGMELLARKDYRVVDTHRTVSFVGPVFDKYNRMVRRMQDLERAHVNRETALRDELEAKTRTIVQQQAMLGRIDRLTALGDVAARMAHRLRNPLTGVLVTLTNLCEESQSPHDRRRLKLSIAALMRSFNELTELLEESREEHETAISLTLADVVDELFLLIRHQSNRNDLILSNEIDPEFQCTLPETATRHALMKLLENAVETQDNSDSCLVKVTAKRSDGLVEIDVDDAGPGIDDEHLDYRPWNQSVRDFAQNAGLHNVQRFCERMDGRLRIINLPHEGSRVCLILPQEDTHV